MKILFFPVISRRFITSVFAGYLGSFIFFSTSRIAEHIPTVYKSSSIDYRQRHECNCVRPSLSSELLSNQNELTFCSHYATRRGPHQRIMSISLFGPKENTRFQFNRSITFLNQLINDVNIIYPDDFILRIYHDDTINMSDVICPIECQNPNVDFCNMNHKHFIPPKIWRFIPAGDPLVDVSKYLIDDKKKFPLLYLVMSRDLDSPLTPRERSAVNVWLMSNKAFHAMRDHPKHRLRMLGGMWGFQSFLNRSLSHLILNKIHNRELIKHYTGHADQTFLTDHVWPYAKSDALVHDSFHCTKGFGQKPVPFPTQRPSVNETNCFVGCIRPCCTRGKRPFNECPKECRPKGHPEWIYC
jgi:hypothetical protein